jgi:hypothetical protein
MFETSLEKVNSMNFYYLIYSVLFYYKTVDLFKRGLNVSIGIEYE